MASFSYNAINESGRSITGSLDAESPEAVESILLSKGYIPTSVISLSGGQGQSFLARLKASGGIPVGDLILFTKQFRSMMQAGVSILRILEILANQTANKALKKASVEIGEDIRVGNTLYQAMVKHPSIFSPLYLSMIDAGEISGTIPGILERLITMIEHEAKIRSDIKSALQYPKLVVGALAVAFFVLLTFVIPKFAGIFAKAGLGLPLPTRIAMCMYQGIANYWHIMIGVAVILFFALRAYFKTAGGRFNLDTFLLQLPLVGPLYQKAAMSRFASIFAILLSSGVPVIQALDVLSSTIGNSAISREFDKVRDRIKEGHGIASPLGQARYFTPMVVSMVAIGEESGQIDDMLRAVAAHYDDEVGYAVKKLSDNIGPILIVGLAAVVGFFALAIYMPMWDMTKMAR
jgi:type IV pilus assembly protein PilC